MAGGKAIFRPYLMDRLWITRLQRESQGEKRDRRGEIEEAKG